MRSIIGQHNIGPRCPSCSLANCRAADPTRRFLLGWFSVPAFDNSEADGEEPLDVVAGFATDLGGVRSQPPLYRCGIRLTHVR
jgi:hypothetical protein